MEERTEKSKTLELAREFLDLMGVSYSEVKVNEDNGITMVSVYTDSDSKILIGKQGTNLLSLTLIFNMIVKKKYGQEYQVFVDVNDYQKNNLELIKKKASIVVERVKSFQVDMELEPMNSLERRFVHSLFGNEPDIITCSSGTGGNRKITVCVKRDRENI